LSIDQFNEIFTCLWDRRVAISETSYVSDPRRLMIRTLDSLGHCEFDFDRRSVWICRPVLSLLPSYGLPKAVLTGARTPALVKRLKLAVAKRKDRAYCTVTTMGTGRIELPSTISIEAVETRVLNDIAEEAGISHETGVPVAWQLAKFSMSIDELETALIYRDSEEINWPRQVFSPAHLVFTRELETAGGIPWLAAYRNPADQQLRHLVWKNGRAAEVDRDWGRYLILSASKRNVLIYDQQRYRLAVPLTVPLPCLLSRALTLCTGKAPTAAVTGSEAYVGGRSHYPLQIFDSVHPAIATLVSDKTGQNLIPGNLELVENGLTNA